MTASEYNASIHLQATLHCIVWLFFSCRFLLPPPHVVLPFTTVNAWNMTGCEYDTPLWLLMSCSTPYDSTYPIRVLCFLLMTNDCFLLPPLLSLLEVNELVNIVMLLLEHVLHYAALVCTITHKVCFVSSDSNCKDFIYISM